MIGGVSFQPGQNDPTKTGQRPTADRGVQEAIKVLSLRLPKVVGARALAPSALLNAQGSGGNTRIDSVVNQVLQRYLPGGAGAGQAPPAAPMIPTGAGGAGNAPFAGQYPGTMPLSDLMPTMGRAPRITPIERPSDGSPRATPGPPLDPSAPPPPAQLIDVVDRGRAAPEPSAPPPPTQDPWADLVEYLRRQPAPPPEQYSI